MNHPFVARYAEVCRQVAAEFERNIALHGERIHCCRGCSQCCYHLFQITEVEAAVISRAVKAMPPAEREDLRARARDYLPRREEIMQRHGMIEAWGRLPPEGTRLACPALSPDGACRIYEHRPLICRKFGIPLYNPQRPGRVFACELNFSPGEEIDDPQLVQIQTGVYHAWKTVQDDYNQAGGRRDDFPVTVAHALLNDFEEYLPEAAGKESVA
ncbi:MAG: YkgJ family cysteine cluster protein [Acidobacteria bacterium]|nr:YkgJ family cysteine cluster protein [Acidobacteriota bacterium]